MTERRKLKEDRAQLGAQTFHQRLDHLPSSELRIEKYGLDTAFEGH